MADFEKKVSLIEVDVDVAKAQNEVEKFTKKIIDQKDAVKLSSEEIKALEKETKSLSKAVSDGTGDQEKNNKTLEENNKILKDKKVALELQKDKLKDLNRERANAVKQTKLQSDSLGALKNQASKLTKELNDQKTSTKKGADEFNRMQKELKETNDKIKQLDQGAGNFKSTIGDYPKDLGKATDGMNDLNKSVDDSGVGMLGGKFDSAADGLDGMKNPLKGASSGFLKLAKSAMSFIMTPIGAILAAIVAVFLLVKNAMDRNEKSSNKIKKAFSAFSGIANTLLGALEPLGEFLIDGIVKGFDLAAEAADKAMSLISDGLSYLGFDEAAKNVEKFTEEIKEGVKAAAALADMEAKLQEEQRKSALIQLEYQKEAEKLRQIRDDDSISIRERIKANEDLGKVLQEQLGEEKAIANTRLKFINDRIKLEGETTELLDEKAEALTEIADIEERITGQESEQLTNRNSLLKEEKDLLAEKKAKKEEEEQAAIEKEEERLEKEKEARDKALEEQAAFDEAMMALDDAKTNKIQQNALRTAKSDEERLLLKRKFEEDNFNKEYDRLNQHRQDIEELEGVSDTQRLTMKVNLAAQMKDIEAAHEAAMYDLKKEAAEKELSLDEETQAKKKEAFKQAEKAGRDTLSKGFEVSQNLVDNYYGKQLSRLDERLRNGEISEEQHAKKKAKIEQNAAKDSYKVQKAAFLTNKVISLVDIGVNTARGIANALGSFPPPVSFALAAATGALGIAQGIAVGTKRAPAPPQFARGGDVLAMTVGGELHSNGGTKYHGEDGNVFEVEKDEGIFVTSRAATNPALALLDKANTDNGGVSMYSSSSRLLERGGRVDQDTNVKSQEMNMMKAISEMPAPVVDVRTIMGGVNAEKEAESLGVID